MVIEEYLVWKNDVTSNSIKRDRSEKPPMSTNSISNQYRKYVNLQNFMIDS